MLLTTGYNQWNSGLDVVVEGDAIQVTDDALLQRLAEAWTRKWDGRWRFQAYDGAFHHHGGGEAHVLAVKPIRTLAFGKGAFSHTRFQF